MLISRSSRKDYLPSSSNSSWSVASSFSSPLLSFLPFLLIVIALPCPISSSPSSTSSCYLAAVSLAGLLQPQQHRTSAVHVRREGWRSWEGHSFLIWLIQVTRASDLSIRPSSATSPCRASSNHSTVGLGQER